MKALKETKMYGAVEKETFFVVLKIINKVLIYLLLASALLFLYRIIKNIDTGCLPGLMVIFFAIILILKNLDYFFTDFIKNSKNKKNLAEALTKKESLFSFLNFKSTKYFKKAFILSNGSYPDSTTILRCFLDKKNPRIIFIFSRLLIDFKGLKKEIKKNKPIKISSDEFLEIMEEAGTIAIKRNGIGIKEGDIISALAKFEPNLKNIIIESEIEEEDFEKVNEWQERISIKIKRNKEWWSLENLLKLGSLGKDWTSGYTPTLDDFSIDWTDIVQRRGFEDIIGHKQKVEQLERILSKKNGGNALMIGEPGVGKKNIIHSLIKKSLINQSIKELNGKRFVELDIISLSSNVTSHEGMENILNRCFEEAVHAGNVILIINDFHDFLGAKKKAGIIDISRIMSNYLYFPQFKTICLTSYKGLHKYIENKPSILSQFQRIEIEEMKISETIQILENRVFALEMANQKFFSYASLKEITNVCNKYIFDFPFPQKAINLLEESAVYETSIVIRPEDVDLLFSEKTKIPVGKIRSSEKEILLNMEDILHKRIVGQLEAVKEISSSLRRARSGIKTRKGPMGSFLFLGPTGVGKTETAKALAETYFKSEEKIIRLDMSEFQTMEDIARLLGSDSQEGILTTKVKEKPFSLVLLDEIEKAHPNLLNIFLQILDEGYVNDNFGRKINFENTIVIATSNAGYKIILDAIENEKEVSEIKKELLSKIFEEGTFRPEFINRFDGVIVFKSLTKEELKLIAKLQLEKINKNLAKKKIKLVITEELKEKIVELSYNPMFGAREMKRTIQDKIENSLAKEILKSSIPNGSTITIDPQSFEISII